MQYPCFGGENQLWYLGSIELDNTYVIPTPFDGQYRTSSST